MCGEGGRPSPALGEGGNGDGGGDSEMRSAQDAVLATRAEIRRRGAAQERGIVGWGRRETRTAESCGEARASRAGMAFARCERERGDDARWARGSDEGPGTGARA